MLRLFIGCPIDMVSESEIAAAVVPLHKTTRPVRWLKQSNWHVTLAFIGDVQDSALAAIEQSVSRCLVDQKSLSAPLVQLAAFPDHESAILAAIVEASDELKVLQQRVAGACAELSIPLRDGAYRPHITLARKARGILQDSAGNNQNNNAINNCHQLRGDLDIKTVALYRSVVTEAGREYHIIKHWPLT